MTLTCDPDIRHNDMTESQVLHIGSMRRIFAPSFIKIKMWTGKSHNKTAKARARPQAQAKAVPEQTVAVE